MGLDGGPDGAQIRRAPVLLTFDDCLPANLRATLAVNLSVTSDGHGSHSRIRRANPIPCPCRRPQPMPRPAQAGTP